MAVVLTMLHNEIARACRSFTHCICKANKSNGCQLHNVIKFNLFIACVSVS